MKIRKHYPLKCCINQNDHHFACFSWKFLPPPKKKLSWFNCLKCIKMFLLNSSAKSVFWVLDNDFRWHNIIIFLVIELVINSLVVNIHGVTIKVKIRKKRKDEFACLYFCKILVIAFKEMQFGDVRLFYHVIKIQKSLKDYGRDALYPLLIFYHYFKNICCFITHGSSIYPSIFFMNLSF